MLQSLMHKIHSSFGKHFRRDDEFYFIKVACVLISIIAITFTTIVFIATGISDEVFERNICFRNSCVENFSSLFSVPLAIIKTTGTALLGIFAFGSFGIASKNYVNSKNAYNSNIHVSNVAIFLSYVQSEIIKQDKLKSLSFDLLKLYNTIYQQSQSGKLEVSAEYYSKVKKIQEIIHHSNLLETSATIESFNYKHHQSSIIKCMSDIGISLHRMPRLDFYDIEGQVFELLNIINTSFCSIDKDYLITSVRYYK